MRQVASRYNELSSQLEKTSLRNIEIAEGSLNATTEKIDAIEAAIHQNREALNQNDSEAILRRVTQLQPPDAYKPETPPLANNNYFLRQDDSVFVELESLLQRIGWEDFQRQSRPEPNNNIRI